MHYDEVHAGEFAEVDCKPGESYTVTLRDRGDGTGYEWHVILREVPLGDPDQVTPATQEAAQ